MNQLSIDKPSINKMRNDCPDNYVSEPSNNVIIMTAEQMDEFMVKNLKNTNLHNNQTDGE